MSITKKKPIHYVNNKEFYQAMLEYKRKCNEAIEAGLEQPRITNYIGDCLYKIANKLSFSHNFINYSYREDMISDGLEQCIANIKSFNPELYNNPFAYFTQICYHAFVQRIQKEKKQQYIKYKSLERAIISNDQHSFQDEDDQNIGSGGSSGYNEAAIHVISSYEDAMKKKKDAVKIKKQKDLEKFIEEENENAE